MLQTFTVVIVTVSNALMFLGCLFVCMSDTHSYHQQPLKNTAKIRDVSLLCQGALSKKPAPPPKKNRLNTHTQT